MIAEKEMTALESSVAAEAGQSSAMNAENSIAQPHPDGKKNLQVLTKELRAIQRANDPNRLKTFTMQDLYETVHPGRPPIVDGLLYPGTYIFAGAPKVGKSFLMEQFPTTSGQGSLYGSFRYGRAPSSTWRWRIPLTVWQPECTGCSG